MLRFSRFNWIYFPQLFSEILGPISHSKFIFIFKPLNMQLQPIKNLNTWL